MQLRNLLDFSSRLAAQVDARKDVAFYQQYDLEVAREAAALSPGDVIVDLGGGRTCSFAARVARSGGVRIIAVDASAEELAANNQVDETRVADVSQGLPFDDGSVDLLVSRTLLEHVDGVDRAAQHMARVLKPGGKTLHLVPCRYALFAVAARVVPFELAKRVVHGLIPESRGVVEFPVFYDNCYPSALRRVFRNAGFRDVQAQCTWDQSGYFQALLPVFVGVYGYQRAVERLNLRLLASYAIVRATR